MQPKPAHLTGENAARFQDPSVVDAYQLRPPYPPETFTILADLIVDQPRIVLDVGTGPGKIARELAPFVDRVDALDWSAAMIALGQRLPGGNDSRIRWLHARVEEADLHPPYALITAGVSLHWMDWEVVLPRFHDVLTPGGVLALVNDRTTRPPWHTALVALIQQYSTQQRESFSLIEELSVRGLFRQLGERQTPPMTITQSVDDYIAELHSHSHLTRADLGDGAVEQFDAAVREMVAPHVTDQRITLEVTGQVIWGAPLRPVTANLSPS